MNLILVVVIACGILEANLVMCVDRKICLQRFQKHSHRHIMAGYALKRLLAEYKRKWSCFKYHLQISSPELTLYPPDGIVAGPVSEENFFEWECLITFVSLLRLIQIAVAPTARASPTACCPPDSSFPPTTRSPLRA